MKLSYYELMGYLFELEAVKNVQNQACKDSFQNRMLRKTLEYNWLYNSSIPQVFTKNLRLYNADDYIINLLNNTSGIKLEKSNRSIYRRKMVEKDKELLKNLIK